MQKLAYYIASLIQTHPHTVVPIGGDPPPSTVGVKPECLKALALYQKPSVRGAGKRFPGEALKFVAAVVSYHYQIAGHYLPQDRLRKMLRHFYLSHRQELMVRSMIFGSGFKGVLKYYDGSKMAYPVPYLLSGARNMKMAPETFLECVRSGKPVDPTLYYKNAPVTVSYDEFLLFGELYSPFEDGKAPVIPSADPKIEGTKMPQAKNVVPVVEIPVTVVKEAKGRAVIRVEKMTLNGVLHLGDGVDLQINSLFVEGDASFL